MQMKKARGALVGAPRPPLPPIFPMGGADARARLRLHSLMQDYEELLKEIAAKRKRLQMERHRVLNLTDEVKFLRKRYKYLIKNPYPTPYMVKTHSQQTPSRVKHKAKKAPAALNTQRGRGECAQYGQQSQHDSSNGGKDVVVPSTPVFLDLNQISLPEGDEGEFHVSRDHVPMENSLKRYLSDGDVRGSEPTSSVCHVVGSGTNRAEKRRISWQDRLALKV